MGERDDIYIEIQFEHCSKYFTPYIDDTQNSIISLVSPVHVLAPKTSVSEYIETQPCGNYKQTKKTQNL